MKAGSYLVDHTTSSPSLAIKIAELAKAQGVHSVDAPVSGGDIGARNGALVTMVGGDQESVDGVRPLLDIYSQNVQHMGAPGAGQHTKAANQIMIATTMVGLCESLLYAQKAGLDHMQMINLLSKGAAGSFSLEKLGPRMMKRDFEPGFYVEHFVKDLGICLDESKRMNISVPGTALAAQMY
jgi:3-hydroxyisobutyrate dehydrogenase